MTGAPVPAAQGQARIVERHGFGDPEGRLLAFFAASMAFTPAGLVGGTGLGIGVEASYVPYLDKAQRRPSIDKPEATNLAPVFPRPRVGFVLGTLFVEASWIPPVRVFDITANVFGASVSGPSWANGALRVTPRAWLTIGRVEGTITCAASEMLGRGPALETYYAAVCHGNESEDWFDPRMAGVEVIASRALSGTLQAYAGAGARVDRSRFDIGVIRPDGSRDTDHPILELEATRPHLALGAGWTPRPGLASGLELFYAPGSVLTVRASARWSVRP